MGGVNAHHQCAKVQGREFDTGRGSQAGLADTAFTCEHEDSHLPILSGDHQRHLMKKELESYASISCWKALDDSFPEDRAAPAQSEKKRAGYKPGPQGGNSRRAGFATQPGATELEIMRQTGHRPLATMRRFYAPARQVFRAAAV